jgi:hypothetical protein
MRRLPGPAVSRLSEGDHTPEALYELFRDWRRTQTQSSVTAPSGPRQQMDVLVLPSAGTDAERPTLRVEHPGSDDLHALPSVPGTSVPSLDR